MTLKLCDCGGTPKIYALNFTTGVVIECDKCHKQTVDFYRERVNWAGTAATRQWNRMNLKKNK